MSTLYRGGSPVSAIYRGTQPVGSIYRGGSLLWTGAPIFDGFDNSGWLVNWINEYLSLDPGALISDGLGNLRDGLGNLVGNVVAFVQGGVNQVGQLVTNAGTALVNAYCAAWAATSPGGTGGASPTPQGVIGLLNGIPLVGPFLNSALTTITNLVLNPSSIISLIGNIPVIGNLAKAIGLLPDEISGAILPPINYIIDQLGSVLGTLTCGVYTPAITSVPEAIQYVIGMVNQRARMLIPGGLMSLDTQTSRFRWPTPLGVDDGYIEVRVTDGGAPGSGMATQVFRRYSDSGYHQGTGLQFMEGSVSILHRASDTDNLVVPGITTCQGGDRFRLVQSGSTHILWKNGQYIGAATGIAAPGAGSRSVGMLMQAGKELLGPRQYSPSLDYLEAA